jgi:hypothetical protein
MTMAVLKSCVLQSRGASRRSSSKRWSWALEIARERREGRRIGTLFTLGAAEAVLASSRPLILDPLLGHAPRRTHISDPDLRGTIKELASPRRRIDFATAGSHRDRRLRKRRGPRISPRRHRSQAHPRAVVVGSPPRPDGLARRRRSHSQCGSADRRARDI